MQLVTVDNLDRLQNVHVALRSAVRITDSLTITKTYNRDNKWNRETLQSLGKKLYLIHCLNQIPKKKYSLVSTGIF